MTAKEYAWELVEKYNLDIKLFYSIDVYQAKQCAIIAIDQMLEEMAFLCIMYANVEFEVEERRIYLQEVKKELEAL
jgi:hypothetical protein